MKRQSLELAILLVFAVSLVALVGSLFLIEETELRQLIWPCIFAALVGLVTFCGFIYFGKSVHDPSSPRVVASLPDEMSASAIVVALSAHGINARAVGGYTSGFQTEIASDVRVVVSASEFEAAKSVIETQGFQS